MAGAIHKAAVLNVSAPAMMHHCPSPETLLRTVLLLTGLTFVSDRLPAAAPVRPLPQLSGWVLETSVSSYIIARNEQGGLQQVYWGGRIDSPEELTAGQFPKTLQNLVFTAGHRDEIRSEEYPGWGGARFEEPCLKVTLPDGVRDTVLVYHSDRIDGDRLELVLKDIRSDLLVRLHYRVYADEGIIAKHAVIENQTGHSVTLESAQSGVWNLPMDRDYRLTYLTGHWGGEAKVIREPLHQGMKVIESRRGTTGFESNPWFAIDAGAAATEESGRVWFGALAWSGNWRISIEQTSWAQPRITGGFNPFDFGYRLNPGERLVTPPFYGGYTDRGFGDASRRLHDLQRNQIRPHGREARLRPVWYNSWQVYEVDVTEENQKALADKAAALGVELFVVDDGWFNLRKTTGAGLGDWFPDRDKFPNGLKPLADHVNRLGMDFGLWVEPEMVNPDSDLYRRHPDWILRFEGRPLTSGRGQYVLNLARDEVKEYLIKALDTLVREGNVRLFKWDMNRLVTEPGWPEVGGAGQRNVLVQYTQNLYEIVDRLRALHPGLEFESCKGGGGRLDLGILERVDQFWTSDNTDPLDRIRIQEGFSFAYSPQLLMGRVAPAFNKRGYQNVRLHAPLEFRFLVAMMGSLGLSLNLNELSSDDEATARKYIAFYKTIRETTQRGHLHRLSSLRERELAVNQFVAANGSQSVVFVLQHWQEFYNVVHPPVTLRGLEPTATYRVHALHPEKLLTVLDRATGAYLMQHGLNFRFAKRDLEGTAVVLERLP